MDLRPHRRWNPLKEEWVLVSPHRAARPWQGAVEKTAAERPVSHDSTCYLCPGNLRTSGERNPSYTSAYVFNNDFPTLLAPGDNESRAEHALDGIIVAEPEHGVCRVICFSPRHDLTLAQLSTEAIEDVIATWGRQYQELISLPFIEHVMIFENKGQIMGCSNPHPHCQIWSTSSIPNFPKRSIDAQRRYFASHGREMLLDYAGWEIEQRERVVASNDSWIAVVPYWAAWPFEIMILPRRAVRNAHDLSPSDRAAWAAILSEVTIRYDNLFQCSFPYSMGVFQPPATHAASEGFVLHQSFLPPLLRSATIKKFMVGYELCAEPQRDITAEQAAGRLRECGTQRFEP